MTSTENASAAKARAEALFKSKQEGAGPTEGGRQTVEAEKTAKLRALRLAKEEAEQAKPQGHAPQIPE
jgi:hypothetical protein